MNPKISIVTPSFNQGRYIEQCLQSVQDQDFSDVEQIVFDGGSKDNTVEVLRRYENRGVRWTSEKDKGQSDAINKGFLAAKADIIGWLNSDDWYARGAFRVVIDYFRDHPEAQWVYGNNFFTDAEGRVTRHLRTMPYRWDWLLYTGLLIPQPGVFFRRRILEDCGLLDVSLHGLMDYEWWLRIVQKHPPHFIDRFLAYFRFHPESKTCGALSTASKLSERTATARRYEQQARPMISGRLGKLFACGTKRLARWARYLQEPRGLWNYCTPRVAALVSSLDSRTVAILNKLQEHHDLEVQVWTLDAGAAIKEQTLGDIRFPWRKLSGSSALLTLLLRERPSVLLTKDSMEGISKALSYCYLVRAEMIRWQNSISPVANDVCGHDRVFSGCSRLNIDGSSPVEAVVERLHGAILKVAASTKFSDESRTVGDRL